MAAILNCAGSLPLSLASAAANRVNNFRIIRLIAAISVIISHAVVINFGMEAAHSNLSTVPALTGITYLVFGDIAVDVFFSVSGFLIANSLLGRNDIFDYIMARILRISPGLIVMVFVCAFVLGPVVTDLGLREYLGQRKLYGFLVFDSLSISPLHLRQELPGVFENNPYPRVVNASLWTLPWEIWMYISLLGLFICRLTGNLFPIVITVVYAIYGLSCFDVWATVPAFNALARLAAFFYCGVALFRYRNYIRISGIWALTISAAFIVATAVSKNPLLLPPYVAYMTVFAAYWPPMVIERWSEGDDISYGMYIYAYPIQQTLVFLLGPHSVILNCFLTLIITSVPAYLSWLFIEKPALRLRSILRERPERSKLEVS